MKKVIGIFIFATLATTCRLYTITPAGNLTSFRRDDKGNITVAVGIFMNSYPTVVDGEFFPFELHDEEVAAIEEEKFKGFAADVITAKHPFEGFKDEEAVKRARARAPQDPYHFDGYYLKIMVVNDKIETLPHGVYLHRGFFPHNFYCPDGQESVQLKADDSAVGNPEGANILGSPVWAERAARTVTFCKTKEVNGPYAGRDLYYTRVSLFAEDAFHFNELEDPLNANNAFNDLDSQFHETISARVSFFNNEEGRGFSEAATVVNLNYEVKPAVLEMQELLRQNSTADLAAIRSSTDTVQHYLHDNRKRAHDANWQVLLLAQRKWLAIRLILEDMGMQQDQKAEELRLGILSSLELADIRDMLPLAAKLPEYQSATDYLNALRNNPASTLNDDHARKAFFDATSRKHFNRVIYHTAIATTTRQWYSSRALYGWLGHRQDITAACNQHCPAPEQAWVQEMSTKMQQQYANLPPASQLQVHSAWDKYVSAINETYPDSYKAPAAFKKKYVVAGNAIDFENSSQAYKNLYAIYAKHYDLVFSEPHGLLMGTEAFIKQMGEKRKPDDVLIFKDSGKLRYDWKIHPPVQINTVETALNEMLDGILLQAQQLHKLAQKLYQHGDNDAQQIKVTSDFADNFQILPIAKALLIRPDYAYLMREVFDKYTRFRPVGFFSKWVLGGVTIGATIAAIALSVPTLGLSSALGFGAASTSAVVTGLFAAGSTSGLLSSLAQYQHGRVLLQKTESSLFSDSLGTNFAEFHRARQEYLSSRRDLYITAGFTAFDAVSLARLGLISHRTTKQIRNMEKLLAEKATEQKYSEVFKHLKHCSSKYCRKFLASLPVLKTQSANDIEAILIRLRTASGSLDDFKTAVKNLWMEDNTGGAFNKIIKMEFIDDVVRSRFFPFTNARIPFAPPKLRGLAPARKSALSQLLDKDAFAKMNIMVDGRNMMNKEEILETFASAVYGTKYKKKLLVFNRSPKSVDKLIARKLDMTPDDMKKMFASKEIEDAIPEDIVKSMEIPEGFKGAPVKEILNQAKKGDKETRKNAKSLIKRWLNARKTAFRGQPERPGQTFTLEDTENFVELYHNERRITSLRADFKAMLGKIGVYKKNVKIIEGTPVPGLELRGDSFIVKKDVLEQMVNSGKWQKIFNANDANRQLREDLLKDGGELQTMVNNLNELFNKAYIAYNSGGIMLP